MKQLPKKWCVKGNPTNPYQKDLIAYADTYGAIPPYHLNETCYFHFPSTGGATTRATVQTGYTEITLPQFKKWVVDGNKSNLQLPIIYGIPSLLIAFVHECQKFGYSESTVCKIVSSTKHLKLNGISKESILRENGDGFKVICANSNLGINDYFGGKDFFEIVEFNLPVDWDDALTFMKENMKVWKSMLSKSKIFKMTSSSGDFELEVSKKGIYYRPEDAWLDPDLIINNVGSKINFKKSNEVTGDKDYNIAFTKMDVGCKKDTLISQWKEVYRYYNSIKNA